MSTKVEKTVVVDVPLATVYDQWTQFEEFPHFMSGVESVRQLEDDRLEWVAEIGGVRRQWQARILEQVPERKVAWAATEGAINAGAVTFEDAGEGRTRVHLELDYEPEGPVEKAGDALGVIGSRAEKDLERFKAFIEDEGYATGAWRGAIRPGAAPGAPDVRDAAASRGDDGGAGISGKAVAAGAAAAAAVAGAAAVAARAKDSGEDEPVTLEAPRETPVAPVSGQTEISREVPVPGERSTGEATRPETAYDVASPVEEPATERIEPVTDRSVEDGDHPAGPR